MAKILKRALFRRDLGLPAGIRSCTSEALVEVNPGEVGIISGIPQEQLWRRHALQLNKALEKSGSGKSTFCPHRSGRIRWTSTGDPYANVGEAGVSFDSVEAAKAFAEKYGWEYETYLVFFIQVKKHHTPIIKAKSYADDFKWKGPPPTDQD